ncbi:hypothetical protein VitviT2T_014128 [Vitis vinifera]|uniref:Retrovirus-related Pol polyprotein from transposon TNT 1-94-like beta-barrel domain-containing protein n=1 Tax=Vitis vinifera TaxID=29760 RepID=A0ABY9CIR5_VITVI|nr:hypothetical protein VitviT2T_014128 [Vitis vinifera]
MKAKEWALLDRQVLGVIMLILSRSVAHNVVKEKTTADLMTALLGIYEKPSTNNKVQLMKKLFNLKMVENASIAQHLNEFNTITNQLSSVEIDVKPSWEAMRMAVSNSMGKEKLKYNDIRDLILVKEIRRKDAGETLRSGYALNLETSGRGDFGKVYLADGSTLDVVGLGDVRISLANGSVWFLEKVRYIPNLKRNLIFVGQLDDEGHAILFVGGIDSRKSTIGFVFTLGGTTISWASNLQKIVTLSTTEAEYVAATEVGKEMIWLHGFLDELGKKQEMGILHSDSQSVYLKKRVLSTSRDTHEKYGSTLGLS